MSRVLLIVIICVSSGLATHYVNHFTTRGPVFASALIALLAGLTLPRLLPNQGATLALAATCASYAGMAARSRLKSFWDMALCGVFVSVLFVLTENVFVGIGGKLGTIAGIAVISIWGVRSLLEGQLNNDKK